MAVGIHHHRAAIGFVWLIVLAVGLRRAGGEHASVSPAELALHPCGSAADRRRGSGCRGRRCCGYKQIWPFLIAKLLTDPVWWFYLYWLPSYLSKERGRNPLDSALLLALIYTAASVGSIAGGWLSGFLIGRGWRVGAARYGAMLGPAVLMPFTILAYYTRSFTVCVA